MQKAVSPKHFLSSLREKTHRSKGGVGFGSYVRLYADWKTILILYALLLLMVIGVSGYLFYRINNHRIPGMDTEMPEVRVRTFSREDLDSQIKILREKRGVFTDRLSNPSVPQI